MKISTEENDPAVWSWIYSPNITISGGKGYTIVSHVLLNSLARQSHIVVEGLNGTSQKWHQIWHCPTGTNGPMEWNEFVCEISTPVDTNALRLILNAGWSSSPENEASSWFDDISVRSSDGATIINSSSAEINKESSAACKSVGFVTCQAGSESTSEIFN
jgi:hypothetical protein